MIYSGTGVAVHTSVVVTGRKTGLLSTYLPALYVNNNGIGAGMVQE